MSFKTQQIKVTGNITDQVIDYLVYGCRQANDLTNCVLFDIRQSHFEICPVVEWFDENDVYRQSFKTKKVKVSYSDLCKRFKSNKHYQALGGQQAQQVIKTVVESFKSYNGLLPLWFKGELDFKPKMPNYRTKGGLTTFTIPAQGTRLCLETGLLTIPISRECKSDFKLISDSIKLPSGFGFKLDRLSEVRVFPRNREIYVEYVYRDELPSHPNCNLDLDHTKVNALDPGVGNWLTSLSSTGKSFIVDGHKIKSLNQWYNKRVASIKKGKPQGYWDNELASITEKRNRQMRDVVNKAARFVINNALENRYGVIVFGWGNGIKTNANMGSKNNQEFVQIPTARLRDRIKQLCIEYGIEFIQTEESYTSKASFLDDDFLATFGEKPDSWKPSGKRGKKVKGKANNLGRGGYETATKLRINSDCNGAANILRKVTKQLSIKTLMDLAKIGKEALTLPKRYDVFKGLKKSYRKQAVAGFDPA